jgi:DNA gyrase/topoisomerase IV subunit B
LVYETLIKYFTENEEEFVRLLEKIKLSAKARMAAKLARETVLRKSVLNAREL